MQSLGVHMQRVEGHLVDEENVVHEGWIFAMTFPSHMAVDLRRHEHIFCRIRLRATKAGTQVYCVSVGADVGDRVGNGVGGTVNSFNHMVVKKTIVKTMPARP